MSTWWADYSDQRYYPSGFADFIQWLNQVKGWSKYRCQGFAIMYKINKDHPKLAKLLKQYDK